LKPANILID